MDFLEVSAKTVEEAIEKALDEMGLTREEVNITVLQEGKEGGLFGIGSEEATVKVEKKDENQVPMTTINQVAVETLDKLVKLLEVDGKVISEQYAEDLENVAECPLAYNVEGDDLGILIGRRGQTLAALQYILRLIVGHQTKTWIPIVVDAEGYKQRRSDALKSLAERMAAHVKQRGAPFTLEPMPAHERRIIHLTLADNKAVYTESVGEGENRKVIIYPKQRNGNGQRGGYQRSGGYNGFDNGQRGMRPRRRQTPPY